MTNAELKEAHRLSGHHRTMVEASAKCGCFYCLRIFDAKLIKEWMDSHEEKAVTALCPLCGIDSVIPEASGFQLTKESLSEMHNKYFHLEQ